MKRTLAILAPVCVVAAVLAAFTWRPGESPARLPLPKSPSSAERLTAEIDPPVAPIGVVARNAGSRTEAPLLLEEDSSRIFVRARDAITRAPLADVEVLADAPGFEVETRTGSDGWAEVNWPDEQEAVVRLRSPGHAERTLELTAPARTSVELLPLGTLSGFVIDRDTSRPVADATVLAGTPGRVVVTDRNGRFSVEDFPFGRPSTFFMVTARGYGSQHLQIVPDRSGYNVLELAVAQRLVGTVFDYDSGLPVSGVEIRAGRARGTTELDGSFDVEVPPRIDVIEVTLLADGYCEATVELKPSAGGTDLFLPRTATVAGIVRDGRGNPVAGASVGPQPDRVRVQGLKGAIRIQNQAPSRLKLASGMRIGVPKAGRAEAVTGTDGRFVLEGRLPGATLGLQVRGEDLETRNFTIEVGGPGSTTEVDLFPGSPLEFDRLVHLETMLWRR